MEALSSAVYELPPGTVEDIRRMYNLDKPGRMDEAINILDSWVKEQSHFNKKDFSRGYLERFIISCKGSVERAKLNVDRFCTLKSQLPRSFLEVDDAIYQIIKNDAPSVFLPKFAPNYQRVLLTKCSVKENHSTIIHAFYKYSLAVCDYMKAHDYFNGFIAILDYRDMNISDFVTSFNLTEFRLMMNMYIEGYAVRIQGIHIVTSSKVVDLLVKLLKQVVSPKIRNRLHAHKSIEELYSVVPREILPIEYGGKEKCLRELHEDWCAVLNTEEHKDFMRQMNQSVTDCRQKTSFDSDSIGLPGTFKTLILD